MRKGFTLIELLLVIGVIAVIAGVVIVAVSPRKNFISARDAERKHSSKQLQQAIYAQLIDNWEMDAGVPECTEANKATCSKPICKDDIDDAECTSNSGVPFSSLPPSYISELPVDVVMPANSRCTGYMVYQEVGRPKVYAANMGKLEGDTPEANSECGTLVGGVPDVIAWSSMGSVGFDDTVKDLQVIGGELYVAGDFDNANGDSNADGIIKWDGSSWSSIGDGLSGHGVFEIEEYDGKIFAGGRFYYDAAWNYIAVWDGVSWEKVGGTGLDGYVYAMAVYNGELYVGGDFTDAGGNPNADNIAKWNGTSWSDVGGASLDGTVMHLTVHNGELYVGGFFTNASGIDEADKIAKWNGTSWSDVGGGASGEAVYDMETYDGELYIAGSMVDVGGNTSADYIARWNGSNWNSLPVDTFTFFLSSNSLGVHKGKLYVGGMIVGVGGDSNYNLAARWDGASWSNVGTTTLDAKPLCYAEYNGKFYLGGSFEDADGIDEADFVAEITVTP